MEEKERYKIDKSTNYYTHTIVDTKTNAYYGNIEEHIDLLNQQDKENQQLKQQLAITEKALELACEHIKEDLKCDDTQDEIYNYFKKRKCLEPVRQIFVEPALNCVRLQNGRRISFSDVVTVKRCLERRCASQSRSLIWGG